MLGKLFTKAQRKKKPQKVSYVVVSQKLHIHLEHTHRVLEYDYVLDDRMGLVSAFDTFCGYRVAGIGKNGVTIDGTYYPPHRIKHIVLGEKTSHTVEME